MNLWFWQTLNRLTGGRPMKYINESFRDIVDGRMVNLYEDGMGRKWLAHHRWALFRVEVKR